MWLVKKLARGGFYKICAESVIECRPAQKNEALDEFISRPVIADRHCQFQHRLVLHEIDGQCGGDVLLRARNRDPPEYVSGGFGLFVADNWITEQMNF
jgi:hypothetical protein